MGVGCCNETVLSKEMELLGTDSPVPGKAVFSKGGNGWQAEVPGKSKSLQLTVCKLWYDQHDCSLQVQTENTNVHASAFPIWKLTPKPVATFDTSLPRSHFKVQVSGVDSLLSGPRLGANRLRHVL